MDAREVITVGMSAERIITVRPDLTVQHFVPTMPAVYATPMMIMQMEMASVDAISRHLAEGWVTVGTEVDIRHLGASAVGALIRTTARVVAVERRVIRFEVDAYEGERKIATISKRIGTTGWANLSYTTPCQKPRMLLLVLMGLSLFIFARFISVLLTYPGTPNSTFVNQTKTAKKQKTIATIRQTRSVFVRCLKRSSFKVVDGNIFIFY